MGGGKERLKRRVGDSGDLFSVWPLIPLLKRKVSGVMSVCVSNVSGWQEVVCHWSSLPISLWGLSSPPPHKPLYPTQGQTCTHTHTTRINDYHPTTSALDHLITPSLPPAAHYPTPTQPAPPHCLTSAPLLLHSPSMSFPGSSLAECDEWDNITLVLCWPGLAAPAHLPPSVCQLVYPSVCVSLSGPAWNRLFIVG